MAEIDRLEPGQQMPDIGDDVPWLLVEASDNGKFRGSGWARKGSGEDVFYVSAAEDDVSLERAIHAAQEMGHQIWRVANLGPRFS